MINCWVKSCTIIVAAVKTKKKLTTTKMMKKHPVSVKMIQLPFQNGMDPLVM